jgi:hypothetical protein
MLSGQLAVAAHGNLAIRIEIEVLNELPKSGGSVDLRLGNFRFWFPRIFGLDCELSDGLNADCPS